jgi:hypothetical protein
MKRCNRSRATVPVFAAAKVSCCLGLALVACLLPVRAGAGDWPQFPGQRRVEYAQLHRGM